MSFGFSARPDPAEQAERFKDDPSPKWKLCGKKDFAPEPNGKIHCFLSVCQVVCDKPGFIIDGKERVKCKGGKKGKPAKWKGTLGTCMKTCSELTAPAGIQQQCKTNKKAGLLNTLETYKELLFVLCPFSRISKLFRNHYVKIWE